MQNDENQDFSGLHEIHEIEDKIIASSKANTTPVMMERKSLVVRVGSKALGRSILYYGPVDCSAS